MTSLSADKTLPQKDRVFFSIIIPMYNRATLIRRCLDSCLSQNFKDYEIIVVDDGSEDNSVAVVESYLPNPHIILVKSPENRGVCAARGLGVVHAKGKWVMFMDSDDVFHPGAFQIIYETVNAAPQQVSEVRFCYWREEISHVTPIPLMPEGILCFSEYLQWLDKVKNSDLLYCQRREIHNVVTWPQDRRFESQFHLKVASKFKMMMSRQVVGTMYNDADNRIITGKWQTSNTKKLQTAYDNALSMREMLEEFGDELKKHCPGRYKLLKRSVGNCYFRAGYRLKGCRYILAYLLNHPLDVAGWGVFVLGMMGPKVIDRAAKRFRRK